MRGQAKAPSAGSKKDSFNRQSVRHTARRSFLLALTCLLTLVAAVPMAQAATTYTNEGQFGGPGSGPGEVRPGQVAVDADGDLLVVDRSVGFEQQEVHVYRPQGPSVDYLTSFGLGELIAPFGIATDQASGAVYVSDGGSGQIIRYTSNGAPIPTFTPDPTFSSPPQGFEPGQIGNFSSPLAVDSTTGDLLVADRGTQQISRFSSSGAFISSFDGVGSNGGRFQALSSLTVDSAGDVYVVDVIEGSINFPDQGRSVVERFNPDGTPDNSFAPEIQTPRVAAFDSSSGNLLVIGRSEGGDATPPFPLRLYAFHDDEPVVQLDLPANTAIGAEAKGIAAGIGPDRRVYVSQDILSFGNPNIYVGVLTLAPRLVPDLTLNPPTEVTTSSVHLSGAVNPLGLPGFKYRIEYSAPGVPTKSTPEIPISEGSSSVNFDQDITGLAANNTYAFKIVAESSEVTFDSQAQKASTPISAPAVATEPVVDFTATRATLRGSVNPFGLQTRYYYEYGVSASYGSRVPVSGGGAVAGKGYVLKDVAHGISGLQPATTYHYRLIAESSAGLTEGEDRTFTTAAAELVREYEQISPVEKGGANAEIYRGFQPSPDGNRLAYQWKTSPSGSSEGGAGPLFPRAVAFRGADGWNSVGTDPPQRAEGRGQQPQLAFTLAVSEDASKALVISARKLAPGAAEGDSNIYLRDLQTGSYTTVATTPGSFWSGIWGTVGNQPFFGGTPDFSHVLLNTYPPLLPGGPEFGVYEWDVDHLHIHADSEGNPITGGYGSTGETRARNVTYISEDGATLALAPNDVTLSHDGRYRFFISSDLTSDSIPGMSSLYRRDAVSGTTVLVASDVIKDNSGQILQISDDGAYAYYIGGSSNRGIYVWHNGQTSMVAPPANNTVSSEGLIEFRASTNGKFFVFGSRANLTGFDGSNPTGQCRFEMSGGEHAERCLEIYRYSVETDDLTCVSCRADGAAPTGDAHIGSPEGKIDFGGRRIAQAVSDDGRVFFDTPDPLSGRDANSVRDVYEFDGTRTTLISAGTGDSDSNFGDATADGRNVYFTTLDRLVGQDEDFAADIYVARVGGGIAAQNPPPRRAECIRDDCKATPNAGPELPFGGSEGLSGPENVTEASKQRCGKGRHARKVKGKSRCVKKHHKKQAKSNRRQGR